MTRCEWLLFAVGIIVRLHPFLERFEKYCAGRFNADKKTVRHRELFPLDCQKAFELRARLVRGGNEGGSPPVRFMMPAEQHFQWTPGGHRVYRRSGTLLARVLMVQLFEITLPRLQRCWTMNVRLNKSILRKLFLYRKR